MLDKEDPRNTVVGKIAGILKDSKCITGGLGSLFCVDTERRKMYQITPEGTSVTQMGIIPPKSYDFERNDLKIKWIDDHCRISTPKNLPDSKSLLMCYKGNKDPDGLDIGRNLEEMNERLDKVRRSL